jgi:hypothetical protein
MNYFDKHCHNIGKRKQTASSPEKKFSQETKCAKLAVAEKARSDAI